MFFCLPLDLYIDRKREKVGEKYILRVVFSNRMRYNRGRQFNNGRRSYFVVTLFERAAEGEKQ